MRVYAVAFCANGTYNISQEAYSSLEAAQRFVESRRPNPKKVSEMFYPTVTIFFRFYPASWWCSGV